MKGGRPTPMVLVLVHTRSDAHTLSIMLKNHKLLRERPTSIAVVTGHGSGSTDGMSVKKQAKLLGEIKEHKYQVLVATSVAEEGIDIPECELVVQLEPPNNLRSLVQIRGRARMKDSRFVAYCRSKEQKESFEMLKRQEENMMMAVKEMMAIQDGYSKDCDGEVNKMVVIQNGSVKNTFFAFSVRYISLCISNGYSIGRRCSIFCST